MYNKVHVQIKMMITKGLSLTVICIFSQTSFVDCLLEQTHPDIYVGEDQDVSHVCSVVWCVVSVLWCVVSVVWCVVSVVWCGECIVVCSECCVVW